MGRCLESLVEDAPPGQECPFAGDAPRPEVSEVQFLTIVEPAIAEKAVADIQDVVHDLGHLQSRRPGGVTQNRKIVLRVLLVAVQVLLEKVRVSKIIIIEEEHDWGSRDHNSQVLSSRCPGMPQPEIP